MVAVVQKLLESRNTEDILIAMEFMKSTLTIKELENLLIPKNNVIHLPGCSTARKAYYFRVSKKYCVAFSSQTLWYSFLKWEERRDSVNLGNHWQYKP